MSFSFTSRFSILYDRANRLALVHQIEGVVDLLQRHHVRDQRIDLDLLVHVPVHDLRHIGSATRPAKRRPLPHPPRHQLERPRLDLLPPPRPPHDHPHPPPPVPTPPPPP